MTAPYTFEDFQPHVGKRFVVEGSRFVLHLKTVAVLPPGKPGMRVPFTLIFEGPAGDVLPEGLHPFAIEGGESVTVYVTPIHTPQGGHQDYQAAFN